MGREQKQKEERQFRQILEELTRNNCFFNFDTFIIREMGFDFETRDELEKVRRPAMKKFRSRTNYYPFASLPTIRKWFGIGKLSKPRREQIYEICLVLQESIEKTQEYLMIGLGESSFELSDYREMIFCYGIENHLSFPFCQEMIAEYENRMPYIEDVEEAEENKMVEEFSCKKQLSPKDFLMWMLTNAPWFKGYNYAAMNCIYRAKKFVIQFVQKEASERLDSLLAETDFRNWVQKRVRKNSSVSQRELIKRYVIHHKGSRYYKISKNMCEVILELSKIVYSEIETNSRLLAEVYSASKQKVVSEHEMNILEIKSMTGKHLSDLLNIPIQQRRALRVTQAQIFLQDREDEELCPEWICQMWGEYTRSGTKPRTVGEAKKWLNMFEKEQQRRRIHINRKDILPLAHYIAQHCYLQRSESRKEEYDADKASLAFRQVANEMLAQCGMAELREEFEIDAVLLACFQPEEMYSYTDVLDIVG